MQRERYLKPGLQGEEIWCQMFSEPSAGSDVAGIRSRAVDSGDDWIINGQKVWTTGAHIADFGLLLARTDPSVPKHHGLSMFILDMRSSGVDVRPIRQISGESDFNEVFLTDVRIPKACIVGKPGDGWKIAITTLMNERLAVLNAYPTVGSRDLLRMLLDLPKEVDSPLNWPEVPTHLVDAYLLEQGLKFLKYRLLTQVSSGQDPGPEASVGKLLRSRHTQGLSAFVLDTLGPTGCLTSDQDSLKLRDIYLSYFMTTGLRIGGGTEDIQKNILAERILGLAPEPAVDRKIPFNQLKTG